MEALEVDQRHYNTYYRSILSISDNLLLPRVNEIDSWVGHKQVVEPSFFGLVTVC
jgi:hypothetical protein